MLTFVKFAIELADHITVKANWIVGKTENLMPVYFTAVL